MTMATSEINLQSQEVLVRVTRCSIHRDDFISLFCTDCDCLVCASCILDTHTVGMHKLCKISQVVETKYSELQEILKKRRYPLHTKQPNRNAKKEGKHLHDKQHCSTNHTTVKGQIQETESEELNYQDQKGIVQTTGRDLNKGTEKESDPEYERETEIQTRQQLATKSENKTDKELGKETGKECEQRLEERARKDTDEVLEKEEETPLDASHVKNQRNGNIDKMPIIQQNSVLREKSQYQITYDVLCNLKRIKQEEQTISNSYEVMSAQILNRTEFLQQELEKRKKILLNKLKTLQEDQLQNLMHQKADLELCESYMDMYLNNPNSVQELNNIIPIKVLQIIKSLPDNKDSKNTEQTDNRDTEEMDTKNKEDMDTKNTDGLDNENTDEMDKNSTAETDNKNTVETDEKGTLEKDNKSTAVKASSNTDGTEMDDLNTGDHVMKYEYKDLDVNGIMGNLLGDIHEVNQSQTAGCRTCYDSEDSEDSYEDVQGFQISRSFGYEPIQKISPIDEKTAFVVQNESLYKVDFATNKRTLKNLQPIMSSVIDITTVSEMGIYVCQQGRTSIKRYNAEGKILNWTECRPCLPRSIYLSNEETIFVSTVCAVPRSNVLYGWSVTEFRKSGEKLQTIQISTLWDMFLTEVHDSFTSLTKGTDIMNLNSSGKKKLKINDHGQITNLVTKETVYEGTIGLHPADHFLPTDMCRNHKGEILVTDYRNHAVQLLKADGSHKEVFLTQEDGIYYPVSVAVDQFGWVWVGCEYGQIQIFPHK